MDSGTMSVEFCALVDDCLSATEELSEDSVAGLTLDHLHELWAQASQDMESALAEGEPEQVRESAVMVTTIMAMIHDRVTGNDMQRAHKVIKS